MKSYLGTRLAKEMGEAGSEERGQKETERTDKRWTERELPWRTECKGVKNNPLERLKWDSASFTP